MTRDPGDEPPAHKEPPADEEPLAGKLARRARVTASATQLHRDRAAALVQQSQQLASALAELRRQSLTRERRAIDFRHLIEAKDAAERAAAERSALLLQVVHDLRQPLLVIGGRTELLRAKVAEEQRSHIAAIEKATANMLRMIEHLLENARADHMDQEAPRPAPVELDELLNDLGEQLLPQAEAKALRIRVVSSHLRVLSDLASLGAILRNLADNACKYTPAGGRVLIGCRRRGLDAVEIQVHDSGIGIDPAKLAMVFEPFRRIRSAGGEGGVGLGLSIVRRLSDALGHRLTVHSRPGGGSCFGIVVPLEAPHERTKS
jgi:signal transduction histidine kinase